MYFVRENVNWGMSTGTSKDLVPKPFFFNLLKQTKHTYTNKTTTKNPTPHIPLFKKWLNQFTGSDSNTFRRYSLYYMNDIWNRSHFLWETLTGVCWELLGLSQKLNPQGSVLNSLFEYNYAWRQWEFWLSKKYGIRLMASTWCMVRSQMALDNFTLQSWEEVISIANYLFLSLFLTPSKLSWTYICGKLITTVLVNFTLKKSI